MDVLEAISVRNVLGSRSLEKSDYFSPLPTLCYTTCMGQQTR